eukprot:CCRYP_019044-RJ/>CCRYP_019044-RJ protein AED:0.46 eAED:0.46 QI:0/0/0/1/0/0/2/0/174
MAGFTSKWSEECMAYLRPGLWAMHYQERLNKAGYFQSQIAPGLWKHKTRSIQFILVVDDFGIKYLSQDDLNHLLAALRKYYDITWDYDNKRVHLSMVPYLQKALRQFDNLVPTQRQDSPYPYTEPKYGAKQQFRNTTRAPLPGKKTKSTCNKSLENSIGTLVASTGPCSCPSVP